MPKRKFDGAHRRVRSRASRQLRRDTLAQLEQVQLPLTEAVARRGEGQWAADPYAPQIGDTIVLAVSMSCSSCPTEIEPGAEGTYIDGELNCSECTWEARHPQ